MFFTSRHGLAACVLTALLLVISGARPSHAVKLEREFCQANPLVSSTTPPQCMLSSHCLSQGGKPGAKACAIHVPPRHQCTCTDPATKKIISSKLVRTCNAKPAGVAIAGCACEAKQVKLCSLLPVE
jgi:hypothetical protein